MTQIDRYIFGRGKFGDRFIRGLHPFIKTFNSDKAFRGRNVSHTSKVLGEKIDEIMRLDKELYYEIEPPGNHRNRFYGFQF